MALEPGKPALESLLCEFGSKAEALRGRALDVASLCKRADRTDLVVQQSGRGIADDFAIYRS